MLALRLTREVHETRLSDRKNALSLIARYLLQAYCFSKVMTAPQLSLTTDSSLSVCGGIWLRCLKIVLGFFLAAEMSNLGSVGSQELNEA